MTDPKHLMQYVDYINNTGQVPLKEEAFIEDWEPIGQRLLADLRSNGMIYIIGPSGGVFDQKPGIYLRPDLVRNDTP